MRIPRAFPTLVPLIVLFPAAQSSAGDREPLPQASGPSSPLSADQQQLIGEAISMSSTYVDALAVEDDVVYVGWHCFGPPPRKGGLQLVDVKDPSSPRLLTALTPGKDAIAIAVEDGRAYVGWRPHDVGAKVDSEKFQIYNVRNPRKPKCMGAFPGAGYVECLAVAGRYAYLSMRAANPALLILDVDNPAKPSRVGYLQLSGGINDIKVKSNLVYLASSGLKIVDVSSPSDPKLLGHYDSSGLSCDVSLVNDTAYVPIEYLRGYFGGVSIIDVSNPAAPCLVDRFTTGEGAWHIATAGNVAYVAGHKELKYYDVERKCRKLGSYQPRTHPGRMVAAGNRLYLADGLGFQVLDITDPKTPRLLGQYDIISERNTNEAWKKIQYSLRRQTWRDALKQMVDKTRRK